MSRVPIPTDWDGESYCCRIIQWPNSESWTAILLGLITWPMRGRFWDERTGTVTDAQAIGDEIYDLNVTDGGCILGCIEDISAYLERIASALELKSGCNDCPTSVTGTVDTPAGTIGTDAGDAPEGYNEELTSENEKCDLANWYWQQTLATFQAFIDYNIIGWISIGLAAAVGIILTSIEAIAGAVWLGIMTGQFGAFTDLLAGLVSLDETDLQDIVDAIDADQQGFVCALYTGADVQESSDNIIDWAQDAGLSVGQLVVFAAVLNNYTLAGLYYVNDESVSEAAAMTGKVSCVAGCLPVEECGFEILYGSGTISYEGDTFVLSSEPVSTYHEIEINAPCGTGECPDAGNWCIQVTAYTFDDTSHAYSRTFRGWGASCTPQNKEYQGATPSGPPLDTTLKTHGFAITDSSAFTVTMKILGRSGQLAGGENPESYTGSCP